MGHAQMDIHVPATATLQPPKMLAARVTDPRNGVPVKGVTVELKIEGHGTFESGQYTTERTAVTDENGEARFEWWEFPIYEPRRELNAVIHAECDDDVQLIEWGKMNWA